MIHKYKLNGYNIVLDVNSSAVHIVDNLAYDILDLKGDEQLIDDLTDIEYRKLANYKKQDIDETLSELKKLQTQEKLFSQNTYESLAKKMADAPIKSMCLNVAHDCNLRCDYCFAAKGDFGGKRMLMPFEVGKKAIDFMIEHSGSRHNLELDFFGGEPLMNFDVVKEIVSYARERENLHNKNFRFTITTNGLLLDDEKIKYINQEMTNVVLSLDGRKEINDRLRITPNGKGSYDTIVPKYQKLVSTRGDKDYYVRGTFTNYNKDFSKDILKMRDLGFTQLSIEPVVSDPKLPYSIKEDDLDDIFREYEHLALELLKDENKKLNFFHFMIDIDGGPCVIKRLRGCSCGNEYISVTPTGDIYPCHQFVGNPKWLMGNVLNDTLDISIKDKFAHTNVYCKEECKNCWAKFYCSGGCNANNYHYAGDILKPHKISCALEKKRLECALMMKVHKILNKGAN